MNHELKKLKHNSLIMFIGVIIFFIIGTIFSEASKRVGGFNVGTTVAILFDCAMFICLMGFAYNLVAFINKSAKDREGN